MWSRRIATILLALIAGFWDASIQPWLPHVFAVINLSVPLVVVFSVFSSQERALTAAFTSGVILDVILASNSGLVTIRYTMIALLLHLLTERLFTNRSLFGVYVLGISGIVLNRFLLWLFEFLLSYMRLLVIPEMHPPLIAEIFWMILVITIVFLVFIAFTKRFFPLISRTDGMASYRATKV